MSSSTIVRTGRVLVHISCRCLSLHSTCPLLLEMVDSDPQVEKPTRKLRRHIAGPPVVAERLCIGAHAVPLVDLFGHPPDCKPTSRSCSLTFPFCHCVNLHDHCGRHSGAVPTVAAGDPHHLYVRVDLGELWFRNALALTIGDARRFARHDNVIAKIKQEIKSKRSKKRTPNCRKMLSSGEVAETITLSFDETTIVVANQCSSVFMEATKSSLEWLLNTAYHDWQRVCGDPPEDFIESIRESSGVEGIMSDHVSEDDEETLAWLQKIDDAKQSRDIWHRGNDDNAISHMGVAFTDAHEPSYISLHATLVD